MNLIDSLIDGGWLKTPRIIEAFGKVKREDFLPAEMKALSELNEALPIGYGQTISQPLVVAFMLEQLQPRPGDKILDVGSGSGWTTALLAQIVGSNYNPPTASSRAKGAGPSGKVIAIEVIPELMEFGKNNVAKYKKEIVEFICADGSKGYKKEAPFDGILVSASVQTEVPQAWKDQIKIGGKIVTPLGSSIWRFTKKSATKFEEIEYPGFVFVPLIEK